MNWTIMRYQAVLQMLSEKEPLLGQKNRRLRCIRVIDYLAERAGREIAA